MSHDPLGQLREMRDKIRESLRLDLPAGIVGRYRFNPDERTLRKQMLVELEATLKTLGDRAGS